MSEVKQVELRVQPQAQGADHAQTAALFLERLEHLGRGERATLRRNAGRTLAESRHAVAIFYRILPAIPLAHEEVYFLIATLYGFNDRPHEGNLGATMRDIQRATGADSIDRRMSVLLDAEFDLVEGRYRGGGEMAYRVMHAVKLAAGHEIGVNWRRLLLDLLWWSHPGRQVQKRWARAYFSGTAEDNGEIGTAGQKEGGH